MQWNISNCINNFELHSKFQAHMQPQCALMLCIRGLAEMWRTCTCGSCGWGQVCPWFTIFFNLDMWSVPQFHHSWWLQHPRTMFETYFNSVYKWIKVPHGYRKVVVWTLRMSVLRSALAGETNHAKCARGWGALRVNSCCVGVTGVMVMMMTCENAWCVLYCTRVCGHLCRWALMCADVYCCVG